MVPASSPGRADARAIGTTITSSGQLFPPVSRSSCVIPRDHRTIHQRCGPDGLDEHARTLVRDHAANMNFFGNVIALAEATFINR
jgi:hypothetical protein